jgi:hypothetical protein
MKIYIKREIVNIIEIDNESDSSQYSIPIIKIPILISNSKDKKILEEALMDYGVSISIIDIKIIKEKNLRIESSSKRYRLYQIFSNKMEVII